MLLSSSIKRFELDISKQMKYGCPRQRHGHTVAVFNLSHTSSPNLHRSEFRSSLEFILFVSLISRKESGPRDLFSRPVRCQRAILVVLWRFTNQNLMFQVLISKRQSHVSKARTQRESENTPKRQHAIAFQSHCKVILILSRIARCSTGARSTTWRP